MQYTTAATGIEADHGDHRFPWRRSLAIFTVALLVGLAAGAAAGTGLYWLIAPDCSVSREFLCGLGEVLLSMVVAGVAALVGFVWTAVRQVRRRVPPAHRQAALVAILVGPVGLSVILFTLRGLGI